MHADRSPSIGHADRARPAQTLVPVTGGLVARSGRYSVIATVRLNGRTTTLRGSFTIPAA